MFLDVSARGLDQARSELFYDQMLDRLRAVPGVESATVASNGLLGGGFMRSVTPEGQEPPPGTRGILTTTNIVTPRYLDTLGLRLLRGRNFNDDDRENTLPAALINQAMAKRFWANEDALGKRFRFFSIPQLFEVVGIVSDSNQFAIGETPQPVAYLPIKQHYVPSIPGVVLFVRTAGDPAAVLGTVRQEVQALDRNLPLQNVNTAADVLNQALWAPRMGAALLSLFAVLALALAAVGIYGVMAYSVSQRTHEIGVRMALGAQPNDILRLVVRQGMTLTLVGLGIGLAAAFGLTRFVRSLLFDVAPTDPLTFAAVPFLLALVSLVACYVPARRATRVHPMIALRYE